MSRVVILIYGIACYLAFNAVFLYLAGFLLEIGVTRTVNSGDATRFIPALTIDLALIFQFGFFHSLMAREGFKRHWTRIVPPAAERSTYVLQASVFLALLIWLWQPLPLVLWSLDGWGAALAYVAFGAGLALILWSSHLIDHFELFGLRQVWSHMRDRQIPGTAFQAPALYRFVRHPMQLGVLIVFWATPQMTLGHAVLAWGMTIYVLIGLQFEERALLRQFGAVYANYQRRVPMLLPRLRPISRADAAHLCQVSALQVQRTP